jgi:hypothetical protein
MAMVCLANMYRLWQCNPSYKRNKQQLWPDALLWLYQGIDYGLELTHSLDNRA